MGRTARSGVRFDPVFLLDTSSPKRLDCVGWPSLMVYRCHAFAGYPKTASPLIEFPTAARRSRRLHGLEPISPGLTGLVRMPSGRRHRAPPVKGG